MKLIVEKEFHNTRIEQYLRKKLYKPVVFIMKFIRLGKIFLSRKNEKIMVKYGTKIEKLDEIFIPHYMNSTIEKKDNLVIHLNNLNIHDKKLIDNICTLEENTNFIVLNKPSGLAVQGGKKIKLSLDKIMQQKYNFVKIVHRLDKETSGLIIMAKTQLMAQKLATAFQKQEIRKFYLAILKGNINSTNVNIPINNTGMKVYMDNVSDSKEALSIFTKIIYSNGETFMIVEIKTGRKHQIRVHAQALNSYIIGDKKYGSNDFEKMKLHSFALKYKDKLYFAPIPLDFFKNFPTIKEEYIKTKIKQIIKNN